MSIDRPVEFPGTHEESEANFRTHTWVVEHPDEPLRCSECDAAAWHVAARWPCGTEPPRETLTDPYTVNVNEEADMTARKTKTGIDPSWPEVLVDIHNKFRQIDKLNEARDRVNNEIDQLVREAIDEGERYRDIAAAAGRSVPWVQTVLRRLNVEGPRVRVISARAELAKRLDAKEAAGEDITAALAELRPDPIDDDLADPIDDDDLDDIDDDLADMMP